MKTKKSGNAAYSEVVRPPIWLLALIFFLLGSCSFSIWAAFDNPAGWVSLGIAALLLLFINRALYLQILVSDGEVRVGRAHIAAQYIGSVTELSIEEMRLARGRDANPAAFLALRFWQPRGVKIQINDERDPTPYWLISTKKPRALTEALGKLDK